MTADYEKIIRNAGYNNVAAGHTARIGLTETAAVTTYASIGRIGLWYEMFQLSQLP